mmetsp:Transcript_8753/g.32361  ORF Transcript_8753/g.32361 Transcript_8753/m.32361 type:complete len:104 (-) Transcript_8753:275-586(-)
MGNIRSTSETPAPELLTSAQCPTTIQEWIDFQRVHPENGGNDSSNDIIQSDTLFENATYMKQWEQSIRKKYEQKKKIHEEKQRQQSAGSVRGTRTVKVAERRK